MDENRIKYIVNETVLKTINEALFIHEFNRIPIKELKRQYCDYFFYRNGVNSYDELINKASVNEDKGYSVPLNKVRSEIISKYNLREWQFKIIKGKNEVEIAVIIPKFGDNEYYIEKEMDEYGYFKSFQKVFEKEDMLWCYMRFEPTYQEDVTENVKEIGSLIHITPTSNVQSIKANGFVPKSENDVYNYPERVYFLKGNLNRDRLIKIAKGFRQYKEQFEKQSLYTFITIDTTKITEDVRFFADPNMTDAVYTYSTVPSSTIISEENVDLNNE